MSKVTSTEPIETFNCPHCGGEIKYDGQGATQHCVYCGASVPVPIELRPKLAPSIQIIRPIGYRPTRRTSNVWGFLIVGFVVFMIVITVVLPLTMASSVISSIHLPDFSAVVSKATTAREPTRAPTAAPPTAVPTPAFANISLQFGAKGSGPGQFTNAHLSGVDGAGHIYVGEYVGGRIQVFDSTGKFINQFFAGDKKTDLLGFVVDRKGVVYVADGGDITRYDGNTGKSLGKLKYSSGPGFGELALAPDGSLYAMWYQRRNGIFTSVEGAREDLVHFDSDGKVLKVIEGVISSMTDSVELNNSLAIDGRGNIYLSVEFESTIFKFDSNGKFITRLGSSGDGASQFGNVGAIAVDGQGRIFVVESSNISVLKADGSRVGKIEVKGAARCLFFDDAGALWVTTDDGEVKYQINEK